MDNRTLVQPSSFCSNASYLAYGQVDLGNFRKFGRTQQVSSAINVLSVAARLSRRLVQFSRGAGGHRRAYQSRYGAPTEVLALLRAYRLCRADESDLTAAE
jgi:hypothetical protein